MTIKELVMKKNAEQIMDYCKNTDCKECIFAEVSSNKYHVACDLVHIPADWRLNER
jgi:hypothetical protein